MSYYFGLLSSKYSTKAFMVHTKPADNIPSKNKLINGNVLKKCEVGLPKKIERKNPTQVDVQSTQLIKSPKNLEWFIIHCLVFSNIDPQTMIDVIPYEMKIHINNLVSIITYFIKSK